MKLLLTTIAAVVLVGCGESQQSKPLSEADKAILEAAKKGVIESVKQHLAAGAGVNAKDKYENTPLHLASELSQWGSHKEIVELLIANGADVNAMNNEGKTPLHYSVRNVGYGQCKEIVELLIAKGANVNATFKAGSSFGGGGETPLDLAQEGEVRRPERFKEVVDLLRKHGGKTAEELK